MNSKYYKRCTVPECISSTFQTPEKLFVHVPRSERNKWLRLAGKDPEQYSKISKMHFCEDHFDMPNDMENYAEYRLLGTVSRIRMKLGCLPTRFDCQINSKGYSENITISPPVVKPPVLETRADCKRGTEQVFLEEKFSMSEVQTGPSLEFFQAASSGLYSTMSKDYSSFEFVNTIEPVTGGLDPNSPSTADPLATPETNAQDEIVCQDVKTEPEDVLNEVEPIEMEQFLDQDMREEDLNFEMVKVENGWPDSSSQTELPQLSSDTNHEENHQPIDSDEKLFQCVTCEKTFAKKYYLVKHLRVHSGSKPFKCSMCAKSFMQKSDLVRHQLIHSDKKRFKCSTCEKSFIQKSDLVRHQLIHTEEKPFKCFVCEKSFTQKPHLITHQHLHTGEKPFSCTACDQSFTRKADLVIHQRIHSDDKPFKCSSCDKSFTRKFHLVTHQRTHLIEEPFRCSNCGQSFRYKSHLFVHQRSHSGESLFSCSVCDKSFAKQSYLVRHQHIHKSENPFKCSFCERSFIERSKLVRHLEQVHSGEIPIQCSS